jgi:hypothetical protein
MSTIGNMAWNLLIQMAVADSAAEAARNKQGGHGGRGQPVAGTSRI